MNKNFTAKHKLYKNEFDILVQILNGKIKSYLKGSRLESRVVITDHFIERVIQRDFDPSFVRRMITEAISNQFFQIIFYMHLEDKPLRADIVKEGTVLCFSTSSANSIVLRTVFEPDNRYEFLNIRRFIINL